MENDEYGGIDYFRMIAAVMVIAIHTFPLASINAEADLIVTRIIGRVAVPFFFMTTGFFLFSGQTHWSKIKKFLIKISKLYILAMLIYLPVNIYAGHYTLETPINKVIADIFVNGTLYHLWYFPAIILGTVLVTVALNYMTKSQSFLLALVLYAVGLMGDSYYGLISRVEGVQTVYDAYFEVFTYTRNGLFFAPVFLLLGALVSQRNHRQSVKLNTAGLITSLLLMITEGVLLHQFTTPRHDSMYIMLLPTMYFLFRLLLAWKITSRPAFRPLSLWVYVIHPGIIVLISGGAGVIGLKSLLVSNNLIHFTLVTFFSFFVIWSCLYNGKKYKLFS